MFLSGLLLQSGQLFALESPTPIESKLESNQSPSPITITKEGWTGPPTDRFWLAKFAAHDLRLVDSTRDLNNVRGLGGQISFGPSWFVSPWLEAGATLDVSFGPAARVRNNQFQVEHSGVGGSMYARFSPTLSSLRSNAWTPTVSLYASYFDLNGKTMGRNRVRGTESAPEWSLEQNFASNYNAIWLVPAIGAAKILSPRPTGNTAELLTTRIEGYFIQIGVMWPVYSRYRVTFERKEDQTSPPESRSEKGKFKGTSFVLETGLWIGS